MEYIFSKLYNENIKKIHDFLDSDTNFLYISGFQGSGKSSALKFALETYNSRLLTFHHFCFENSTINDFLLSFYDTFRDLAIKQVINIKKNPEEGFYQKVSFYFKNVEHKSVVIIDNYDTVENENAIKDLLIHTGTFENVKVIVISKNKTCDFTYETKDDLVLIPFNKISIESFSDLLKSNLGEISSQTTETFYELSNGQELYLQMVLTYLNTIKISLDEFIEEYGNKKDMPFGQFITEKQISLIPEIYYPLLEKLAIIGHNVSLDFIGSYNPDGTKQINYLVSKFMTSEFYETYYIKSYLREYFINSLSLQEKLERLDYLALIYESELKKSPKDRLLRLSRETIRKQIQSFKDNTPQVKRIKAAPDFTYITQANIANPKWFVTKAEIKTKTKKQIEEKSIKEETRASSIFENLIKKAEAFEEEYNYKEAILVLKEAKTYAEGSENTVVYSKLTDDFVLLNNFEEALLNLDEGCKVSLGNNDLNAFAKFKTEIGNIYRKIYSFEKAKNCYKELIENDNISEQAKAAAHFELGETFEHENLTEKALVEYTIAKDLIENGNISDDNLSCKITFKLALALDEQGNYKRAYEEYKNTIDCAQSINDVTCLLKSYSNLGVILSDEGKNEEALGYLLKGLEIAKEEENYHEAYYITRNIVEIYKLFDKEKAHEFLLSALELAKYQKDSFEISISLLELGDFYYNLKQNEQALICYFQAKNSLGQNASKENIEIIETRINDMKIKLGNYIFNGMKALYDPE